MMPSLLTFTSVLLFLSLAYYSAEARKVERHCQGLFIHDEIKHSSERKLQEFPGELGSRISIDCMSGLVEYTPESQLRPDECKKEDILGHYSVYLRAEQTGDSAVLNEWELRYLVGGSLEQASYNVPNDGKFALYFENRHTSCNMRITLATEYHLKQESFQERSQPEPALIDISPSTVYVDTEATFTFQLDKLEVNNAKDRAIAIPLSSNCLEVSDSDVREFIRVPSEKRTQTIWKHKFTTTGPYRVCYQRGVFPFEETAQIVSYSSNPQYFVIGRAGRLFLGQAQTFFFIGTNLNTEEDDMKVVLDNSSCESGGAAARTIKSANSAKVYLPGTASAYNITFTKPGRYRMCYRIDSTARWMEVPDIDDMPDDVARPMLASESTLYSKPQGSKNQSADIKPFATRSECTLPLMESDTAFEEKSLQFTLNRAALDHTFSDTIADVLCVPKDTISIVDITTSSSTDTTLTWYVDCLMYDPKFCDRANRMSFAYDTFLKNINNVAKKLQISKVIIVDSKVSVMETKEALDKEWFSTSRGRSVGITLLLLLLLCGVILLGVFVYLSYMGRHGYASPMQAIRNVMSSRGGENENTDLNEIH